MGARLSQRPVDARSNWGVEVAVARGGVGVATVESGLRSIPFVNGMGLLSLPFTMPAVVPGSGGWTFTITEFDQFPDQVVGLIIGASAIAPASMIDGVISTPAVIVANQKVTLQGMVRTWDM